MLLSDIMYGQCEVTLLLASMVEVATLDTDYSKHQIFQFEQNEMVNCGNC